MDDEGGYAEMLLSPAAPFVMILVLLGTLWRIGRIRDLSIGLRYAIGGIAASVATMIGIVSSVACVSTGYERVAGDPGHCADTVANAWAVAVLAAVALAVTAFIWAVVIGWRGRAR